MSDVYLKTGSPVLTGVPRGGNPNFISKAILWADQKGPRDPSEYSHAGIIGMGGTFQEATIIEMTWPKLREVSLAETYGNAAVKVFRFRPDNPADVQCPAFEARKLMAHPWKKWYGLEKLPLFLVDSLLSHLVTLIVGHPVELRFLSTFNLTRRLVCSQLVAYLYSKCYGIEMMMSPRIVERIKRAFTDKAVKLIHERTGLRIATDGPGVTPDDLHDFCVTDRRFVVDLERTGTERAA